MCVPLETVSRQLAIQQMARTYDDDAIRVIVLDSTLHIFACNVTQIHLRGRPKDEAVRLPNLNGLGVSSTAPQATHEDSRRLSTI